LVIAKGEVLAEELAFLHNTIGAVLAPFDCWSLIRGMKTLALRMRQHENNAKTIVQFLQNHTAVTKVFYPGRSGMLSFEVKRESQVEPFLQAFGFLHLQKVLVGWKALLRIQSHRRMQIFQKKSACLTGCQTGY